jgi:hypothetical protein
MQHRAIVSALLIVVVVSGVAAIKCNVNDSNNRPLKCEVKDFPGADTCAVCTSGGSDFGLGGCSSLGQCAGVQSNCVNLVKGTYSSCQTDSCNKCTSASSVHAMCLYALAAAVCSLLI